MKLFSPAYYQKFTCIADRCRHSCCIGWEIDLDKKTLRKYKKLGDGHILTSIDCDETPHFSLEKDERCPHLDENGLCRIIKVYGDGYLCDICREHPRFYHDTVKGLEVGIGMACEEACRLILTEDYTVTEIGKRPGRARTLRFDTLPMREKIYAFLSDATLSFSARLAKIADVFSVTFQGEEAYALLFSSLEYMHEENRARFAEALCLSVAVPEVLETYLSRALAYFVFRHVTAAKSEDDASMAIGFSLLLERLLCSLAVKERALTVEAFSDLARTVSEELEYSEENTERLKLSFLVP